MPTSDPGADLYVCNIRGTYVLRLPLCDEMQPLSTTASFSYRCLITALTKAWNEHLGRLDGDGDTTCRDVWFIRNTVHIGRVALQIDGPDSKYEGTYLGRGCFPDPGFSG